MARDLGRSSLPSAKQLINQTLSTMTGQSSVRLTITSTDKSTKQTEKVTEDAGRSNGLESIDFGNATASVRLTTEAAYISGNTLGLEKIVGLSSQRREVRRYEVDHRREGLFAIQRNRLRGNDRSAGEGAPADELEIRIGEARHVERP